MKIIDIFEYDTIEKSGNLFIFSLNECGSCKLYERELEGQGLLNYIKVETDNEENFIERDLGFVPLTIYYNKDGKIIFKEYGVLFESQQRKLLDLIAKDI